MEGGSSKLSMSGDGLCGLWLCCDFPRAQREKIYVINDDGVQAKETDSASSLGKRVTFDWRFCGAGCNEILKVMM